MRITGSPGFARWIEATLAASRVNGAPDGEVERARQALAAMALLVALEAEPTEDALSMRRVAAARRHPLWRVRPPDSPSVQVRLIVWFRSDRAVVLAGGDKAALQEL